MPNNCWERLAEFQQLKKKEKIFKKVRIWRQSLWKPEILKRHALLLLLLQAGWLVSERESNTASSNWDRKMQVMNMHTSQYGQKDSTETRNCKIQKRWNFSFLVLSPFFCTGEPLCEDWSSGSLGYSPHLGSWLLRVDKGWANSQQWLYSSGLWNGKERCSRISQPVLTNQCGLLRPILWTAINKRTLCLISLMDITFCLQLYLARACRWLWTLTQWLGLDGSLLAYSPVL